MPRLFPRPPPTLAFLPRPLISTGTQAETEGSRSTKAEGAGIEAEIGVWTGEAMDDDGGETLG